PPMPRLSLNVLSLTVVVAQRLLAMPPPTPLVDAAASSRRPPPTTVALNVLGGRVRLPPWFKTPAACAPQPGDARAGVHDTDARGPAAGGALGLFLGTDGTGEAQAAAGVPDAAAVVSAAVRDRQVVDVHADAAVDPEDPAGVVAADGQPVRTRAVNGQVVRDA